MVLGWNSSGSLSSGETSVGMVGLTCMLEIWFWFVGSESESGRSVSFISFRLLTADSVGISE